MLIPTFELRQTAEMVIVEIRVPFVRVSSMEFHVDGKDFHFYCKPYLLKLTLPHEVVDDGWGFPDERQSWTWREADFARARTNSTDAPAPS